MKSRKSSRAIVITFIAVVAAIVLVLQSRNNSAHAQAQDAKRRADVPGITRQAPNAAVADALLDPNDTVVLLPDHQAGLFQTVKDVPLRDLRANTVVLARLAELGKAPIIYTASVPDGSNGPLMEELAAA